MAELIQTIAGKVDCSSKLFFDMSELIQAKSKETFQTIIVHSENSQFPDISPISKRHPSAKILIYPTGNSKVINQGNSKNIVIIQRFPEIIEVLST